MALNARQEKFAQLIASGGISQVEAYKQAGYSPKSAESLAHRLIENDGVKARIAELREATTTEKTLTRQQIREIRAEIATDSDNSKQDRLAALRDDSKMMGWDAPQKIEHSGGLQIVQVDADDEGI
jgi:phage terminase small subunit